MRDKLYLEALQMGMDKNLGDVETLLHFARQTEDIPAKLENIQQAMLLLGDIARELQALKG